MRLTHLNGSSLSSPPNAEGIKKRPGVTRFARQPGIAVLTTHCLLFYCLLPTDPTAFISAVSESPDWLRLASGHPASPTRAYYGVGHCIPFLYSALSPPRDASSQPCLGLRSALCTHQQHRLRS